VFFPRFYSHFSIILKFSSFPFLEKKNFVQAWNIKIKLIDAFYRFLSYLSITHFSIIKRNFLKFLIILVDYSERSSLKILSIHFQKNNMLFVLLFSFYGSIWRVLDSKPQFTWNLIFLWLRDLIKKIASLC